MENDNSQEVNAEAVNAEEIADNKGNEETVETTTEVFTPDDAMLERAVKAGMSIADAKALPSKEFANRILEQLEKGRPSGNGDASGDNGDDFPAIDFGELSEANGYEPNIVKSFNSLKNTIEAQAKVIKKLMAGMSAKGKEKTVETRKNLVLARPGGERGRTSSGKQDPEASAIAALREKFKLN